MMQAELCQRARNGNRFACKLGFVTFDFFCVQQVTPSKNIYLLTEIEQCIDCAIKFDIEIQL